MKIPFQADADLNEEIVAGVVRQEPDIDFRTATEANLQSLARRKLTLLRQAVRAGAFIISQKTSVRDAIKELLLLWSASEQEEWENLIVDLPL